MIRSTAFFILIFLQSWNVWSQTDVSGFALIGVANANYITQSSSPRIMMRSENNFRGNVGIEFSRKRMFFSFDLEATTFQSSVPYLEMEGLITEFPRSGGEAIYSSNLQCGYKIYKNYDIGFDVFPILGFGLGYFPGYDISVSDSPDFNDPANSGLTTITDTTGEVLYEAQMKWVFRSVIIPYTRVGLGTNIYLTENFSFTFRSSYTFGLINFYEVWARYYDHTVSQGYRSITRFNGSGFDIRFGVAINIKSL